VAFGDTSTPLTSEISIRGSGASRGASADSGVGLYRNGAYVGGGARGGRTYSRFGLFDASQIEVLRGAPGRINYLRPRVFTRPRPVADIERW
jgi:iron complex outermembrane receptor protein